MKNINAGEHHGETLFYRCRIIKRNNVKDQDGLVTMSLAFPGFQVPTVMIWWIYYSDCSTDWERDGCGLYAFWFPCGMPIGNGDKGFACCTT